MKIAIVYPEYYLTGMLKDKPQGRIFLGVAYLASALKEAGHEFELYHVIREPEREEFLERLRAMQPDAVGFSCTTPMFGKVKMMAAWVKQSAGLPTIIGGAHATLDPEGCLAEPDLDYLCIGEGEAAIVEFAGALQRGSGMEDIPSIWGKAEGHVFRNPVRPLVEDLDTLAPPDRTIFDASLMAEDQGERITVMASRGCPFRCNYCSNHVQRSRYPNSGKYVRFRSVGALIDEVEELASQHPGADHVRFDDDILTLRRDWFDEFVDEYKKRVPLPFICNSRADLLDEERIARLAEAGCKTVCMGIESGSEWLRREVLGRKMSDEKILEAFHLCRKYGIGTVSLNMVGLPRETFSMVLDTVKLNARAQPGMSQITVFYPFPHTVLHRMCAEMGMLPSDGHDTIFSHASSLRLPGLSQEQVELVAENFSAMTWLYHRLETLPGPLPRLAERAVDAFFRGSLVPSGARRKALEKLRYRIPWEWYMGAKY